MVSLSIFLYSFFLFEVGLYFLTAIPGLPETKTNLYKAL